MSLSPGAIEDPLFREANRAKQNRSSFRCKSSHGSLVIKVMDSWLLCHEFEPSTACRLSSSFLPQLHVRPGWALAFSRSLFQASHLPASVVQFLVLKSRRYFSGSSIHLRFGLPFLRVPVG
ncbi:hypothetical protein TNCV_2888501 [Trichonephila clavipes]|nr:hypothetical protein TNCV_2888501 [Trichonephila clavipes]